MTSEPLATPHEGLPQHDGREAASQAIRKAYSKLDQAMKRPANRDNAYICSRDVESCWSTARIRIALLPEPWTDTEIITIKQRFIRVLSILVYTGAHDYLQSFRSQFFDANRDDDQLPFEQQHLSFLGYLYKQKFYEEQYRFIPVTIVDKSDPHSQHIEESRRLPFEVVEENIGLGGYGRVDRVRISPGYLQLKNGSIFPEVSLRT